MRNKRLLSDHMPLFISLLLLCIWTPIPFFLSVSFSWTEGFSRDSRARSSRERIWERIVSSSCDRRDGATSSPVSPPQAIVQDMIQKQVWGFFPGFYASRFSRSVSLRRDSRGIYQSRQ